MFKTSHNLSENSRKLRMAGGTVLLVIALFVLNDFLRAVTIVGAIYGMITGIVGYCPLTEIFATRSRVKHTSHSRSKSRRR